MIILAARGWKTRFANSDYGRTGQTSEPAGAETQYPRAGCDLPQNQPSVIRRRSVPINPAEKLASPSPLFEYRLLRMRDISISNVDRPRVLLVEDGGGFRRHAAL